MTLGAWIGPVLACLVIGSTLEARRMPDTPTQVSEDSAAAFLRDLQSAVDGRNVRHLASLLHYPTIVLLRGYTIPIENPQALSSLYKLTFTPELRCIIDDSRLPDRGHQTATDAQLTPDGLVLGRGAVRILMRNGRLGIARIAVPPTTSPDRATRPPQRIRLSADTTQLSGLLERDDVDVYVFGARKGQRLFARIEGFAGHDATLRVMTQHDGKNLIVPSEDIGRSWSGSLPFSGDYRLEVVRLARYCDPVLIYFLSVTLR